MKKIVGKNIVLTGCNSGIGYEFLKLIAADGITVASVKKTKSGYKETGEKSHIGCDAVVLSLGARSVNGLYKELQGKYERLYIIGDAAAAGRIADATSAGYEVAVNLD